MEDNDVAGSSNTTTVSEEERWTEEELAVWYKELDWLRTAYKHKTIIAKVVALLSAMGSAYIVYKFVVDVKDAADRRKKIHRTFDRLLLGLCVSDFIASIAIFFGSWCVPANPPTEYQNYVYGWSAAWYESVGATLGGRSLGRGRIRPILGRDISPGGRNYRNVHRTGVFMACRIVPQRAVHGLYFPFLLISGQVPIP